jgi:5'-3' exonuclease
VSSLLLIDLGAIFYAVWHSVPASDPAGTPHDMTVARVRSMAGDRRSHVAVCADSPRNWRHEISDQYKANRESKTEACIAQLRRVCETLRLDGFPVWLCDGYEADDVIATAVREARSAGLLVTIATADKDLMQLVTDGVSVRSVKTGLDLGAPEVVAKFGVRPDQIGDWLALVGDTADNVPGVAGIGAKRATDLLTKWENLASLMAAVEDAEDERVDAKLREKLLAASEVLTLSRRLVSLRDDAPIDLSEALQERVTRPLQATSDEWDGREAMEEAVMDNEPKNDTRVIDATHEPPRSADLARAESDGGYSQAIAPHVAAVVDNSPPVPVQTHAISVVRPGSDEWALALEPMSTPDAWRLAGHFWNARSFGQYPNRESVFAAIMLGRTLGVPAATIMRSVYPMDGKLTLSAQFMVGLVLKSGKATYFKCVDTSQTKATWKTHRKDDPDPGATQVTWTIEDAERAGVTKNKTWDRYRAQMLRWRAATDLARMVFPDVVGGLYTPEELGAEYVEREAA